MSYLFSNKFKKISGVDFLFINTNWIIFIVNRKNTRYCLLSTFFQFFHMSGLDQKEQVLGG